MCKISVNELSSIVHALINVAERLVHDNTCPNKADCKIIQESKVHLYHIREQLLDILNKEEPND